MSEKDERWEAEDEKEDVEAHAHGGHGKAMTDEPRSGSTSYGEDFRPIIRLVVNSSKSFRKEETCRTVKSASGASSAAVTRRKTTMRSRPPPKADGGAGGRRRSLR